MRLPSLICVLAVLSACTTETPVTEIIVVVDTDLGVPDELDAVQISVTGLGPTVQTAVADVAGASDLPVTSTLVYRGGPLGPITVTANGQQAGVTRVERSARVSFVRDRSSVLELHLASECVGQACGAEQTCAPGGCRPVAVGPEELGIWNGTPPGLGADAGPPMDTGMGDTGMDAGDTGTDSGEMDSGVDTGTDSGSDTGVDMGVDAGPPRVTTGLVVLYEFDEGSGSAVQDTSGVGTPMDLMIADTASTTWMTGALSVDRSTAVLSPGPATKVIDACAATDEITIEAWVTPVNDSQFGPARLVTMSPDPFSRNFLLGQDAERWAVRLRTTATGSDGSPEVYSGSGTAGPSLMHVVFKKDAAGSSEFYVNGAFVGASSRGGNFSTWNRSYRLVVANEATFDRAWLGVLHLVAIYDRALPVAEVRQNFMAGP